MFMTITAKARRIPAGEFKARCLALLDEVADTGAELVVTKYGRPVARVVPVRPADAHPLRGSVLYERDLVGPLLEDWDLGK
jgi:prevent-host-death family protein